MRATPQSSSGHNTANGGSSSDVIIDCKIDHLYYGKFLAVRDSHIPIEKGSITAFIGPSGCGKSTALRCLNRMNDLVRGFRFEGHVHFRGQDIYAPHVDPVVVRRYIGMVFQQPNPFAMSIFQNVAFGLRLNRYQGNVAERVELALHGAALWDEVKDKLKQSGLALSGGQQQRLCIARALAINPDVILMDEPASSLDPISTLKIEDLMRDLVRSYTIIIVTHNMQQAARVSDQTVFFSLNDRRQGVLVEASPTRDLFTNPRDQRTEDYITGRFG
jgi:phosphate transport system ATP-binding protein